MSDKPTNYELDDELLSAYLDGELSVDERAAVEARLATDPAVQQLLHELRSVSQSVQAMPTESLGRDLSEEILRRAREAKPVPGATAVTDLAATQKPPLSGDAIPKIKIFGSRRAWIWASMALAAGLLIMIVQSGDESAKKLPPVAARNKEAAQNQPTDESGQPVHRALSVSAAPETPTPPPAAVASDHEVREQVMAPAAAMPAAPISGEAGGGQLSGITRDGAAARPSVAASGALKPQKEDEKTVLRTDDASGTVTALPSEVATDKSMAVSQPSGRPGGPGVALGITDEKQKSKSIVNPITQRFVVVRVAAKPETLKNGTFERLLAENKIEFIPQPAKNQPLSFGGGNLAKSTKSESAVKDQLSKSAEVHAVDMVLVEAPAPAIVSCLAELNKNENDFLSIDVSEESQAHDRFDAKSTLTKKLAEETGKNLSRFSRGSAPVAQKNTFDPRYYFYSYDLAKPNDEVANDLPRAGGSGTDAGAMRSFKRDSNGSLALDDKGQPPPDIRRARGIETRDAANRRSGEPSSPRLSLPASADGPAAPTQSGAEAMKQPMSQRKPNEEAEAKSDNPNDNWKVLFVFTAQEAPAPSAPSDNRPK